MLDKMPLSFPAKKSLKIFVFFISGLAKQFCKNFYWALLSSFSPFQKPYLIKKKSFSDRVILEFFLDGFFAKFRNHNAWMKLFQHCTKTNKLISSSLDDPSKRLSFNFIVHVITWKNPSFTNLSSIILLWIFSRLYIAQILFNHDCHVIFCT